MHQDQTPTLKWVARKIGYSVSGVSRLTRGDRKPTIRTMSHVQQGLGWSARDQMTSLQEGNWAAELNRRATAAYAEEKEQ